MTTFTNPILPGYYPDPSVIRVDDTFYLVNSTFEHFPGIPIHKSTDLVNWELIGHAIDRESQLDYTNIPASCGLYAPTIREHNGTFYIACTLVAGQGEKDGNFYVTAPSPEGPWSDPIWVDFPGIDPSLYFEGDRAWWMGCHTNDPQEYEGNTAVWLQEIDIATGQLVGNRTPLWTGAIKGAIWCEGPHIYKKDGWYYVLSAEAGTEFNHAVTIARSRELTGPYEGNRRNPVLTHRHLGHATPVQYVGHAEIFDDSAGNWWSVALATRPVADKHVLGRETFLTPVTWEDDWPVFAPGAGMLPVTGETGLTSTVVFEQSGHVDGGDLAQHARSIVDAGNIAHSKVLALRGSALGFASVHEGTLRLTATEHTLNDRGTPAFASVRVPAPHSTFAAELSLADATAGAEYGLAALQNDRNHVRASVVVDGEQATLRIIERISETDRVVAESTVADLSSPLSIQLDLGPTLVEVTAQIGDSSISAAVGVDALATETAGGFVGAVVGPFVHGVGSAVDVNSWSVR